MIRCVERLVQGERLHDFKDLKATPEERLCYGACIELGVPVAEFFVALAPGWVPDGKKTVRTPSTGERMSLDAAFDRGIAARVCAL